MTRQRLTPHEAIHRILNSEDDSEILQAVDVLFLSVFYQQDTSAFVYLASLLMQTSVRHQNAQQIALAKLRTVLQKGSDERYMLEQKQTELLQRRDEYLHLSKKWEKAAHLEDLRNKVASYSYVNVHPAIQDLETRLDEHRRLLAAWWAEMERDK